MKNLIDWCKEFLEENKNEPMINESARCELSKLLKDAEWATFCPGCGIHATVEHLQESEGCAEAAASLCGIYRLSKRTTPPKAGPGRPRKVKA